MTTHHIPARHTDVPRPSPRGSARQRASGGQRPPRSWARVCTYVVCVARQASRDELAAALAYAAPGDVLDLRGYAHEGDLAVPMPVGALYLGHVTGSLVIDDDVGGDVKIDGDIGGAVSIDGTIYGDVLIVGDIGGAVSIDGTIYGDVLIVGDVGDDVLVVGDVCGDVSIDGDVGGDVFVDGDVSGAVLIHEDVGGDVLIGGDVGGSRR